MGGSSAFSLDRLEIRFVVAKFCSRLSNANGLAGSVIFEGEDVTSNDVGIMADKIVVDCGRGPDAFKLPSGAGIVEQLDIEEVEVAEAKDIVLEGMELTLGNSLRLMSTKSSYKLWENESVSFPGRSRKLLDAASGTGGGIDAVN